MTTTKVYRNGPLTVAEHDEGITESWKKFDSVKPAGRAGRLESLYASPSIEGVVRWVRGNHSLKYRVREMNLDNNEITILDPENVYAYCVKTYEAICWSSSMAYTPESYWETGIRLSDWATVAKEKGLDPREWEVLVPVSSIAKATPVSDKRILNATRDSYEKKELSDALKEYKKLVSWNKG